MICDEYVSYFSTTGRLVPDLVQDEEPWTLLLMARRYKTSHWDQDRLDQYRVSSEDTLQSAEDKKVSGSSAFYVSIIPASPDRVLKDSWYSPRETQQRNVVSCQAVLFLLIPVRLISRPPPLVLPPAKYRYNTSSTQTTSGENVRAKPDPANQDY